MKKSLFALCSSLLLAVASCNGGTISGVTSENGENGEQIDTGTNKSVAPDGDNDTIADEIDNCADVTNADQLDFDSDGIGDPCDPDPPPETCGNAQVAIERLAPNVLVMLDRSESMYRSRWDIARDAVTALSSTLTSKLRLGLALFPGDSDTTKCSEPDLLLKLGDYNGAAFQDSYATAKVGGFTPMRLALERVRSQRWLEDDTDPNNASRPKIVLLVTDGVPNCAAGDEGYPNIGDLEPTLAAAKALRDEGVRIFVVGIGLDDEGAEALKRIADVGGTNSPLDVIHQYWQLDDKKVETALLSIGASIANCTLMLQGRPADPTRIYLLMDGKPKKRNAADGFVYHEATNTLELKGAACNAAGDAESKVIVIFGCPPGGGVPVIK